MKNNNNLVVHKFGGSCLLDQDSFVSIKKILAAKNEIVVVSAIKGVTNRLQNLLDTAKANQDCSRDVQSIQHLHLHLANLLLEIEQAKKYQEGLSRDFKDIKNILDSVSLVKDYSKEIQDLILGYGEQWCAKLLALYLGERQKVAYLDATLVLFVNQPKRGLMTIDWTKSQHALDQFLEKNKFDQLVITGFIASTSDDKRTTLGRNGSDFSGAIFANLFAAKELIIWTDVEGIYSADPAKVKSAFPIDFLSYEEAFELAYFGAKVIHPSTIAPAVEKKIPIYIKNSFNPTAPGTAIIAKAPKSAHLIRGLSSIDGVALFNIEGSGMVGVSGIAAKVFQILREAHISIILISQASSEHSICFAIEKSQAELALAVLEEQFQFEISQKIIEKISIDRGCAILAVVGQQMVGAPGVAGNLCATLAKTNINIRAIAQGSSERNISVVVDHHDIVKALRAVHAGFYLSSKTISIGVIGIGKVGGALLQQIQSAAVQLKKDHHINLCVRGIMNSQKMLLSHEAINLEHWQKLFHQTNQLSSLEDFVDHILSDEMPHGVIIDCTANQLTTDFYPIILEKGAHIITPNKKANSGDLDFYKKLKNLCQLKRRYYLYETTVCAGLPVIKTLQDFIQTGDAVIKIEGIVSGTLAYIFNELDKGKSFSTIVMDAKEKGYTEPDPRDDLSGMDIARKVVCLAREIGLNISLENVKVHNLVPADLKNCSVEEFLKRLPDYDHEMAAITQNSLQKNEKVSYVASISADGKIQVEMQSLPKEHSFSQLQGTDNMLIFRTHRYNEQPLIIRGPGAGPEVTAAGVFADLLRLLSFL
jgi:aspartokinase/homoserine dehydrogenase 1